MKQIVIARSGLVKSGGAAVAGIFFALSSMAQTAPVDTLQTGYGKRASNEITENAQVLNTTQLNQGIISSTEQLLTGQIAGLRILPGGGTPGSSSEMVLRTGSSVFGNKSPLVVLDGVPLENNSASDFTSALSFLSPHDIESITLLKDAAAVAVYGGRAADGVLYITTKKGNNISKFKVDFTSRAGISLLGKKADVLSAAEFRTLINREFSEQNHLLGSSDTDWQEVIYRKAYSHDQHIGLSGTILNNMPYRLSFGHLNQNGILKTAQAKRNSLALSINPSFLQEHLNLNLHLRHVDEQLRVADPNAISAAMAFDPTQPVYEQNKYGGYRTYLRSDGTIDQYATLNPLSLLEQRQDQDKTNTLFGQAHLQYKLHFLPNLSLNGRYAFMDQRNDFFSVSPANMAAVAHLGGRHQNKDRRLNWEQKEAFVTYEQQIKRFGTTLKSTVGIVSREKDVTLRNHPIYNEKGGLINSNYNYSSYTGRYNTIYSQLQVAIKERYFIEGSLAKDKSSYLPGTETASMTGSVGAAWDIAQEVFLSTQTLLSSFRLYANYSSFLKQEGGSGLSAITLRPDLLPEQTNKWNVGIAWGLLDNRLSGDLNYFKTQTSDMLLQMAVASGGGYNNYVINGGGFVASGLESNLNFQLYNRPDFRWSVGANLTSMRSEVSDFELAYTAYVYGDQNFVLLPGLPINSFYLYEQLYNSNGKPIENGYAKGPNGNTEKQALETTDPRLFYGIRSEASYKKISTSFLLRGSTGNHVFNYADAYRNALYMADGYSHLENISGNYAETGFNMPQRSSSHFLENAAFLRLEYLQLGYDFGKVLYDKAALRLNATAQNAFVLTKYKGQDPEVKGGIDRGQIPQPRTFSLGLNLSI